MGKSTETLQEDLFPFATHGKAVHYTMNIGFLTLTQKYSASHLGAVQGVGVEPPARGHCPLHPPYFTELKTAILSFEF